jgi:hypothetical protein
MRKLFVSVILVALALAASASAGASTPTFVAATFVTTPGALSDVDLDLTVSSENAAPAKIVIYVPQGYGLNTATPSGSTVGAIDATALLSGNPLQIPTGSIVVDNPANYTANPEAQACAPGTHAAVWLAHVANFTIPIYIDPTSSAESTLGAYKLQVCLTAPEATNPQVRLTEAQINLTRTVLTNPSAANDFIWRVLVTPYAPGTSNPNLTGTYELRSDVFLPGTLTLKKSAYDKKKRQATLTGKFLLLGRPVSGVPVGVFSIAANGVKLVGQGKTNKKGVYTIHLRLTKTTMLRAFVPDGQGSCDSSVSSPAPGACLSETITPYFSNLLKATPK